MGNNKDKLSLNRELKLLKQQLSKLEDEDGLCFWTGDGQEINALYARIKEIEVVLNK